MFETFGGFKIKDLVLPLVAAYPRVFGFWLAFPLFGQKGVPLLVRNGVTLAVALFAWPVLATRMPHPMPGIGDWFFIVPKELAIGFFIGFSLGIVVWALESAGTLVDTQTGTNNAAHMDPTAGAPLGPTGILLRQYALALLLASGLVLHFLVALVHSFTVWPWHGAWPDTQALGSALFTARSGLYWDLTLRLVAPLMLALLLTEIGLGLINRSTPQFDVYRLSMPIKVVLAASAIAITAQLWADALVQLFREDALLILRIVGAIVR